jgi:hypothetical protein
VRYQTKTSSFSLGFDIVMYGKTRHVNPCRVSGKETINSTCKMSAPMLAQGLTHCPARRAVPLGHEKAYLQRGLICTTLPDNPHACVLHISLVSISRLWSCRPVDSVEKLFPLLYHEYPRCYQDKETYVPSLSGQWEAHKTPERVYRTYRVKSEVATLHDECHMPCREGMASSLTSSDALTSYKDGTEPPS